jgi:hypothetical protein
MHGGASPIRHGLYSQVVRTPVGELIARFEAAPDPTNTLPELAAARALFADWLLRFEAHAAALLAWHASFSPALRPLPADRVQALETVLDELEALAGPFPEPEAHDELDPQPHGGALRRSRFDVDEGDDAAVVARAYHTARALVDLLQTPPDLKPTRVMDIADGHKILETISKIADRIEKQRSETFVTRPDFFRLMREMGAAVEAEVRDPDTCERIRERWHALRLG